MISVVPKRTRRRPRRSIAEEQESLMTVISSAAAMETAENHSNNNKELDATQLRNITNAQLHSNNNNQETTYKSRFTFKSSANQEPEKDYSSRSHSNDSKTSSEDSGISSSKNYVAYGNHDRDKYKRGYYSEGSVLRDNNTRDAGEDNLSSSYGYRRRNREIENKDDVSSSSRLRTTETPSEIKYRYTNGSSCDMPSDESGSRRKYNFNDDSSKHSTNNRFHRDGSYSNTPSSSSTREGYCNGDNSNNSSVPVDAVCSDSSVSSGGTLTISISGSENQSETRITPPADDNLGQTRLDIPGQTARMEGDNISLSSTMSSLSTSSAITTDSCSTMSSDVAKRQSVSSLSDLEHLGRFVMYCR